MVVAGAPCLSASVSGTRSKCADDAGSTRACWSASSPNCNDRAGGGAAHGAGPSGQHDRQGASRRNRGAPATGRQALGRSRGGLPTKLHAMVRDGRLPLIMALIPGQYRDATWGRHLLEQLGPQSGQPQLVADRPSAAHRPWVDCWSRRRIRTGTLPDAVRSTAPPTGPGIWSNVSSTGSSASAASPLANTNSTSSTCT